MNRFTLLMTVLLSSLLFIPCAGEMHAQSRESGVSLSQPNYAVPSNYSIAKPGELTMQSTCGG